MLSRMVVTIAKSQICDLAQLPKMRAIASLENKLLPVPHADELRGLTLKEAEKRLRHELGFSKSQAARFIHDHKRRLGLARYRDGDGVAVQ